MRKNRMILLAAVSLLISGVLLFAGGNQEAPKEGSTSDKIEITFTHVFSGARGEVMKGIVDRFNASQDRIVVSQRDVPGWYGGLLEQLQTLAVGKQLPEVTIMSLSESTTMRRQLGAVSMQHYIDHDGYNLDPFIPRMLDLGRDAATGEQFALPFAVSTPLIFVNRDLLRAKGIDAPVQPETWAQIREWAKKVSDPASRINGIGFQLDFDTWQFQVLLDSFGGQMADVSTRKVLFNKEAGQRVMDFWLGMMLKDGSFPNITGSEAADNFINGKLGIIVATTGNLRSFTENAQFDLGVLELPKWDDLERKNPRRIAGGGSNIFILPSTPEKQEAAWEFVKFALGESSMKAITEGMGYMTARKVMADPDGPMADYMARYPDSLRAYGMIDDLVNWYNWPRQGARITQTLLDNIIAAFNEQKSGKEALDDAANATMQILGW